MIHPHTWQSKRSVMPPWPGMVSPKSLSSNALLKPLAKKPPSGDVTTEDVTVGYEWPMRFEGLTHSLMSKELSPNGDINEAKHAMEMACSCTGIAVTDHVRICSQMCAGRMACRSARSSSSGPGSSTASSDMEKERDWKMGLGLQCREPRERSCGCGRAKSEHRSYDRSWEGNPPTFQYNRMCEEQANILFEVHLARASEP